MMITPAEVLLCALLEEPSKELAEIEKDQSGDAVRAKSRVLRLPNRTLSPHGEIPHVLFIAIVIALAARRSSQGSSRVKADDLHYTARAIADARTASAGSNGRHSTASLTIAAGGGRGLAGIAIDRTCNSRTNKLWHRGHGGRR